MTRYPIVLRAALVVAASILGWCSPAFTASTAAVSPIMRHGHTAMAQSERIPSALRGRSIYNERCASCHGPSGQGDGPMAAQLEFPPADFTDAAAMRVRSPDRLFKAISEGNMARFMPPWANTLSEAERWDVTFYVLWLATTQETIQQGREIYNAQCADCHGEQGRGDGLQAATLSAALPDFTDPTSMSSKSQADLFATVSEGRGSMPAWADQLNEQELWSVVDFVRTFSYQTPDAVAETSGPGIIPVQIVNGTADTDPSGLSNLEVTLHRFFGDESLDTVSAVSDDEGHVQFEDLPTGQEYSYGVTVRYLGTEYASELVSFPEGATAMPVTVNVYDLTDSDAAIHVLRQHLIFDFLGQGFRVAEMYIIANDGDRTFVGSEDGQTLRFTLPEGAVGLTFDDDRLQDSVIMTEEGFVDTLPVPPGGRQVLLSYTLMTEGESYRFARRIVYPTDNVNALVSDVGAVVKSDFLTEQESVAAGETQRYLHLAGQDLAPGTEFVIDFEKLPATVPSSEPSEIRALPRQGLDMDLLRWAGVLLAAVGVGFAALGYPMLREHWASDPARRTAGLEREREALIQAIAHLDNCFEAGEIPEAEYQRQRANQKARLIEVTRRLRG